MPSFALPLTIAEPAVPVNMQWEWQTRVKTFEGTTPALLDTAINTWLTTLPTLLIEPSVMRTVNLGINAGKFVVLVEYGYWVQITP